MLDNVIQRSHPNIIIYPKFHTSNLIKLFGVCRALM